MPVNHLEQLIAEWYEFQGYFIRRNVLVGKLPGGGFRCELDIVAFHPIDKKLVQIEPSLDADSWAKREIKYSKKFEMGRKYIPALFKGIDIPTEIEQIAVFVFASKAYHQKIGGGKVMLVSDLLKEIIDGLAEYKIASNIVPEQYPLLRTIRFIAEYKDQIF
ncbi:MAG: hypothetical protein JW902_04620 [Syntrophaceae bacterium]|nr:hypothetical protein [Syntrophaceae bacterium]